MEGFRIQSSDVFLVALHDSNNLALLSSNAIEKDSRGSNSFKDNI